MNELSIYHIRLVLPVLIYVKDKSINQQSDELYYLRNYCTDFVEAFE